MDGVHLNYDFLRALSLYLSLSVDLPYCLSSCGEGDSLGH